MEGAWFWKAPILQASRRADTFEDFCTVHSSIYTLTTDHARSQLPPTIDQQLPLNTYAADDFSPLDIVYARQRPCPYLQTPLP